MTQFTRLKQFTQASNKGFTLIELIIGGAVSLVVLSVTLGLVVEQRRLFLGDQNKIDYNQNLRAASDFIGTDVKQVGERISSSAPIPVVRVINGSGNNPDALILQRKLIEDTLVICEDIALNDTSIKVADSDSSCNFSDGNNDNLTDTLGQFKSYRCELEEKATCNRGHNDSQKAAISNPDQCDSECVYAYIYDPVNNRGEFVLYTDETYKVTGSRKVNDLEILPLGNSGQFTNTYTYSTNTANNPIIYILEEKKYGLCDGVLQLTTNHRPKYGFDCPYPNTSPQPVRLVDGIADFQVKVYTSSSPNALTEFNEDPNATGYPVDKFSEVENIEIELTTETNDLINKNGGKVSLKTKFFPRNAKSNF